MANKKRNTQHVSKTVTSDITRGLARMKDDRKAQDGEIEECSAALWDSWPVQEALKESPNDPEAVLATLAGRMFLAGECNAQSVVPSRAVPNILPGSDPTTGAATAINSLARSIYAVAQGEAGQATCLADQLENITSQPEISPETRSVLAQLVLALLTLKRERLAYELKENTEALLGQLPQDEIDREVEDTLRLSQEEGG
jgi:hypothetical protein